MAAARRGREGAGGRRDVSRGGGRRYPHGRGGRRQECAPGQRPPRRHEAGWRRRALLVQVRLDPLPGKPLRCLRRSPGAPRIPSRSRHPPHPRSPAPAAPGKDAAPGWRGSGCPLRSRTGDFGGAWCSTSGRDPPVPDSVAALWEGHGPTAPDDSRSL